MKVKKIVPASLIFMFLYYACAVDQKPKVGNTVNVTNDTLPYSMATITVDPTNNNNIAVSSVRWENFEQRNLRYDVVTYISTDEGQTWKESKVPLQKNQFNSNFPSILYSPKGVLYICYTVRTIGVRGSQIAIHRSLDKGNTWDHTVNIKTLTNELPKLSIDQNENVYVVASGSSSDSLLKIEHPVSRGAIVIAKSSNQGKAFDVKGVSLDNDEGMGPFNLSVFDDGSSWLPFLQFIRSKSTETSYIYGLNSFSKNEKMEDVTEIVKLPRRIPYLSNNVIDKTSKFKDRLYLSYLDGVKDSLETAIVFSKDKGKTWSTSKRLRSKDGGYFSRLPVVSVSKKGHVGVAWLQVEKEKKECWRPYFSFSKDGGENFSDPIALSDKTSCSDSDEILKIGNGLMVRANSFGGHYIGLSETNDGFIASWVDLSSGRFQLYTKTISL